MSLFDPFHVFGTRGETSPQVHQRGEALALPSANEWQTANKPILDRMEVVGDSFSDVTSLAARTRIMGMTPELFEAQFAASSPPMVSSQETDPHFSAQYDTMMADAESFTREAADIGRPSSSTIADELEYARADETTLADGVRAEVEAAEARARQEAAQAEIAQIQGRTYDSARFADEYGDSSGVHSSEGQTTPSLQMGSEPASGGTSPATVVDPRHQAEIDAALARVYAIHDEYELAA